jgi:TolB-like protein
MSSIIEGYDYDIFISYRQKDNKYDGWITEFVDNLKRELEATFKEEISVYFDINPHDGLLETHDVGASLKEKLKCLVFIPIISRTYCDPKSFAWEHEFKAFVEQAAKDQFGLKIKLLNGNVASRLLPVRIYDLDNSDKILCESVLGGQLRGIEFIYKEPGVNRPLKPDDDEKVNLNKTKYRNQINKVGNAIKEIIGALDQHKQPQENTPAKVIEVSKVHRNKKYLALIVASMIATVLIVLGILFFPKLVKSSKQVEKSLAILPFKNDTPVDSNRYFINGVMEDILNDLQEINDLRVISRTSVEKYRNTTKSIPEIAKELGVKYIVEGSGQKSGNKFRLTTQLIRAKKENHLWGKTFELEIHDAKDIFRIQSQIAESIAEELEAVITPEEKQLIEKNPTSSLAAYEDYILGMNYIGKYTEGDWDIALQYFEKAKEIDSAYALAYAGISNVWVMRAIFSYAKPVEAASIVKANIKKAFTLDSTNSEVYFALAQSQIFIDYDFQGAETSLKKCISLNPNNSHGLWLYGDLLTILGRSQEALENSELALNLDPLNIGIKTDYALVLYCAGRYNDAITVFHEVLKTDPGNVVALDNLPLVLHKVGRYNEEYEAWKVDYSTVFKDFPNVFDKGYIDGGLVGALNLQADSLVKKSETTFIAPCEIAQIYACAGNKDRTIDMLEQAYIVHDPNLPFILRYPVYEFIHPEPRYKNLLHKLNLLEKSHRPEP